LLLLCVCVFVCLLSSSLYVSLFFTHPSHRAHRYMKLWMTTADDIALLNDMIDLIGVVVPQEEADELIGPQYVVVFSFSVAFVLSLAAALSFSNCYCVQFY